jgi:polyphosphate kinase
VRTNDWTGERKMNSDSVKFFNRELSWLEFNQRPLDQAICPNVPLLERLKFLAITSSNLDEFFMVRVGGLQLQLEQHVVSTDPAGMSVTQQLSAIYDRVRRMVASQYDCFLNAIEPGLQAAGIQRVRMQSASPKMREFAERMFQEEIYPVMSPMAIDPEGPFPLLGNQSIYLCIALKVDDPENPRRYAIMPLGKILSRFISLPADQGYSYMMLEDVVTAMVDRYFPSDDVEEVATFRITRNADVSVREDGAADLMSGMQEVLYRRRTADCVRLEIDFDCSQSMVDYLRDRLEVDDRDVFRVNGPLDLSAMMHLCSLDGYATLHDPQWPSQASPLVDLTQSLFSAIGEKDILLSHPYESFEPVVRLIEEAAADPDVLAIKQVLYRTSRKSPIVAALKRAGERGKYVTAIVELKARFDEARNIEWARELEQAGVQVIYGVKGLKTHAKVCIIVRREPHGIQRYVHFGTGNYNEMTARLYSDVSFLTCNEELGADASAFFNAVTGYSQPQQYRRIDAAPIGLRKRLLSMIDAETQRKRQGQRGYIAAKLNSLVDPAIIEALYRASQAGVTVRLNVRGVCCLRPGVPGLSDNISVISVVDRFLEHARIMYFYHGGDERMFISSADWMPRNLDRRVELLVPIDDFACRKKLMEILDSYFRDNQNAWMLQPDGTYQRLVPDEGESPVRSQELLYQMAVDTVRQAETTKRTMFEPHLSASNRPV